MNYLVTHYKNLAEQLQTRINHIQQCLYEMDAAAGGGGGLNTPQQTPVDRITLPTVSRDAASGPFSIQPSEGSTWTYDGIKYRIRNGVREWYWVGKTGEGWLPVSDKDFNR